MWLLGEHEGRLDGRGGLVLPPPLRGALQMGCVVTRGLERCLLVFPWAVWQELDEKIHSRLPLTNAQARRFARHFFGGAAFVTPDTQGRIEMSGRQIEYASLASAVVLAGMGTYVEVWNPKDWDLLLVEVTETAQETAEALTSFLD